MTLSAWAGKLWRRPGVEAAFLELQDEHDQCVPLLMWVLWLSTTGRRAGDVAAEQAVALCRSTMSSTIEPLRAARRAGGADRAERLRDEVAAEQDLLDRLELIVTADVPGGDVVDRLRDAAARWGRQLLAKNCEPLLCAISRSRGLSHVG